MASSDNKVTAQLESVSPASRGRFARALRWIFLVTAVWFVANLGGSWLVQHTRIRRSLNARLAAAFGRPVDVRRYSFSLLDGPALEANSIVVAEDPRFGYEYFLRADSLTIRVRWLALLAGHLELGTLSLSHPSLNLVRASDGRWNIEGWLPAPSAATRSSSGHAAPRIRKIEFDSGRINFKRGDEKLAFAFVDVTGSAEQNTRSQWRLNVDASPARASVVLQQAGTLHIDGQVGGTSSRLRPADLQCLWQNAAVADGLRLATGYDHGIRGAFSVALEAHTVGPVWNLQARAELRRLHRWDLGMRADNPVLNLLVRAGWLPETPEIDISEALIEAPRSHLSGSGVISWASVDSGQASAPPHELSLTSSGIDMADALAWIRAFHPGVSEALGLRGELGVDLRLEGWPLRPMNGFLATDGIRLEGGSVLVPIHTGRGVFQFNGSAAQILPLNIEIGRVGGGLRLEGSATDLGVGPAALKLSGRAAKIEDLTAAASALGWNWPPSGWDVEGPANFDLRWQDQGLLALSQLVGRIDLQGVSLRAPFLNRPISQVKGHLEIAGSNRQLVISSADAFGGEWSGTIDLFPAGGEHHFNLSVDRLNAEDLDRWLNPRWREGFLGSVLPFLNSSAATIPDGVHARGLLTVSQFAFSRYVLQHLDGELTLDDRHLEMADATADFYGAKLSGGLIADLQKTPAYNIRAYVTDLNLSALSSGSPTFDHLVAGDASGNVSMAFQGVGRDALFASLSCEGTAAIRNASLQGFDLFESMRAGARRPGKTTFLRAVGSFACRNNSIQISQLRLIGLDATLETAGSVDVARNIYFRVHWIPGIETRIATNAPLPAPLTQPTGEFRIEGPLFLPRISPSGTTPQQ
ncbi:MAG: AsmA family protein [Candidatus Acidiferrales bacterium]